MFLEMHNLLQKYASMHKIYKHPFINTYKLQIDTQNFCFRKPLNSDYSDNDFVYLEFIIENHLFSKKKKKKNYLECKISLKCFINNNILTFLDCL